MKGKRGFTLVELMIVIAIIAIIMAIAIPNLIQARKNGNETAAIGALKTISSAEAIFREGDKEGDGRNDYGTLSELSATQLIDSVLGSGTKQGYVFQAGYSTATSEFLWFAVANPVVSFYGGARYFEVNESAVIFYTTVGYLNLNVTDCAIDATVIPVGK
jgi:prepilin-type N-terminal cleavage/methylation domain-containing protein